MADLLFERYGTLVEQIFESTEKKQVKVLKSNLLLTENEILYLAKNEKVVHLDDLLLRRTSIGWLGQTTKESLAEIAHLAGNALGWSEEKIAWEIDRVRDIFKVSHSVEI